LDISDLVLKDHQDQELREFVKKREFAKISKYLGVEVIHCS